MKTDESVIGIDLGTTFSCVGVWNKETQSVEIVKNSAGKNTTPSWVSYGESGNEIIVGEAAKGKENWVYDVKRILGRKYGECESRQ